jgi:hypothetical protein
MTSQASSPGLARSVLIALLFFLFGDKITTVAKVLLYVWDAIRRSETQNKYVTEASLLALGLGVAAAALLTITSKRAGPEEDRTILAGVFVGLAAGLLQILDSVLSPDSKVSDEAGRYFFFFLVYSALVIGPLLAASLRVSGLKAAISSLARISSAIVLGFAGGAVVTLVIGGLVRLLPVFETNGDWWNAADFLVYRPLAFVWLGTVWVVVTFGPAMGWVDAWPDRARRTWITVYAVFAVAVASLYVWLFLGNNQIRQQFSVPVEAAFAILSSTPLLAVVLARHRERELRRLAPLKSMIFGYLLAFFAFFVCWGTASGASTTGQLAAASMFAIGGAAVPILARVSVAAGDALVTRRSQNVAET